MKIEYICHACLLIDTGQLKIATDPWLAGPAYCEQWFVFPKPVNAEAVGKADVILISHGHEDHFHPNTLGSLPNKNATVFYPDSLHGGTKEFIEGLGFKNVRLAVNFRKYRLADGTSVTYVNNEPDNIIVVEIDGEVFVNVNDALHSEPDEVIDYFIKIIADHWPRIDILFCGFGGASYFPNMFHVEGKDDRQVAAVREQLFAHKFCRIVAGLKPRVAVPFAADFALLAADDRWINDLRFPRSRLKQYFDLYFGDGDQEIVAMYPGDVLEGGSVVPSSPYRRDLVDGSLRHLIDEQYADEIAQKRSQPPLGADQTAALAERVNENIAERSGALPPSVAGERFCIGLTDGDPESRYFNISFENGRPAVSPEATMIGDPAIRIDVSSRILRHSMSAAWGSDAVSIGYGADFRLRDAKVARTKLDEIALALISHEVPTRKQIVRNDPLHGLKFLMRQPPVKSLRMWYHSANRIGNDSYDRSVWLTRSSGELRELYGLPDPVAAGLPL